MAGVAPAIANKLAAAVFAAFAGVALYHGLIGAENCSCFGPIRAQPWATFAFDMGASGALCWLSLARVSTFSARPSRGKLACFQIAVGGGFACLTAIFGPNAIANSINRDLAAQLPAPATSRSWLGQPLPLLCTVDIESRLAGGRWVVVLRRRDCPVCGEQVPLFLKGLVGPALAHGVQVSIASIEVGSDGVYPDATQGTARTIAGNLRAGQQWDGPTPIFLMIQDGIVVAVGRTAADGLFFAAM